VRIGVNGLGGKGGRGMRVSRIWWWGILDVADHIHVSYGLSSYDDISFFLDFVIRGKGPNGASSGLQSL
jgi:hypothetical protein